MESKIIRRHYIFHGWVQGVGFRYRARYAAQMYGVSGWVQNLPDGTVEMEAEGREKDIDDVIMCIEKGNFIQIENIEIEDIPIHDEHGFYCK